MPAPDLREDIQSALAAFADRPLREAATALLSTLGYGSDRTVELEGSQPAALIDACVIECYFRDHMAERGLLFHDLVAPHRWERMKYEGRMIKCGHWFGVFSSFIIHTSTLAPAPSHPIRNRLLRIPAASHDLLAVIKQEGRV